MRLFKKLGLFGFMTLLVAGAASAIGFSVSDKTYNTTENNVQTVAKAQHFFGEPKDARATSEPIDVDKKQYVLDNMTKCEYSKLAYSDMSVFVTAKLTSESNEIFSIGYYDAENYIPAKLELKVKDADGNILPDTYSTELKGNGKKVLNNLSLRHQSTISIEASVNIPINTTIVEDSLVITNIFFVTSTDILDDEGNRLERLEEIVLDHTYTKKVAKRKSLQTTYFEQYGKFTPKSVTKYAGYYAVAFDFENRLSIDDYLEINKTLNPIFTSGNNNKNEQNLRDGKTYVNVRFILTLNTSYYFVEDLDGVVHKIPVYPANHSTSYGNNNIVFDFPCEGINGVKSFYVSKPMLTVSVINKETNKEVASSDFSFRFGDVSTEMAEIKDYKGNVVVDAKPFSTIDADLICIIVFVAISVVTVAGALGLYFYRKIKYANDEFKKVNKIAHIKTSIIAYIFFVVAGLDIYYLIMRCGPVNNSEMFANPVDIIVIVFTLVAFLLGCFFIRKYYISFKETIERNRRIKLNLVNQTGEDSGTISAKEAVKNTSEKTDEETKDNN